MAENGGRLGETGRTEELPEAPLVGAWQRPRRNRWRKVQRSGEAEEVA